MCVTYLYVSIMALTWRYSNGHHLQCQSLGLSTREFFLRRLLALDHHIQGAPFRHSAECSAPVGIRRHGGLVSFRKLFDEFLSTAEFRSFLNRA